MGVKRARFVQPQVVRLALADVHRRALDTLRTTGKTVTDDGHEKVLPASAADLAEAQAALDQALADDDWIEVKAELNAGETRAIFTDLVKDLTAGQQAKLDPTQVGLTKILQYVINWSFTDAHGRGVPFSAAALNNLDTDSYREVSAAVDWHDEQVERRRQQRKNGRSGENALSAISSSVGG